MTNRNGSVPSKLFYEDFIQGFRPTEDGTFELKMGYFIISA